jgi:hypothetical protein
MKGGKGIILVGRTSKVVVKNLFSVCDEKGTNGRVPKIIAISRVFIVRSQRD